MGAAHGAHAQIHGAVNERDNGHNSTLVKGIVKFRRNGVWVFNLSLVSSRTDSPGFELAAVGACSVRFVCIFVVLHCVYHLIISYGTDARSWIAAAAAAAITIIQPYHQPQPQAQADNSNHAALPAALALPPGPTVELK